MTMTSASQVFLVGVAIAALAGCTAGAKREGIIVFGTTMAPGFFREEGNLLIACPSDYPYSCGNGTVCVKSAFKPTSGPVADCDGAAVGFYSTCCSNESVPCSKHGYICRSNPREGLVCRDSHPYACKGGKKCSSRPFKPAGSGDCDGGPVKVDSTCCPVGSVDCSPIPEFSCKANPKYGHYCPTTHPYTCGKGSYCSSGAFKPTSGTASDCDGGKLSPASECCPSEGVIPCNGDAARYVCFENHSKLIASEFGSGAPDKTFYLFDMENKCSKKLPDHPNAVYGHAVGAFKGQVLACSGRVGGYGSTLIDTCHLLTSQGWSQVSSTLVRGRMSAVIFTVDEGTTAEETYIAGGNVHSWSTTEVDAYDGSALRKLTNFALPADLYGFEMAQISADKFLLVGGRHASWQPVNAKTFVYTRSTSTWSDTPMSCHDGYGLSVLSGGKVLYGCGGNVYSFEWATATWNAMNIDSRAAWSVGANVVTTGGTTLYVVGKATWGGSQTIIKYEQNADGWTDIASPALPYNPDHANGVLIKSGSLSC